MLPQLVPYDQFNQDLESNTHPLDWKNPEPKGRYNMVVIGGGTAGLVTAAISAGLGAKTALIEKDLLGGDCLNVGCVPSKALLRVARCLGEIGLGESLGISYGGDVGVDFTKVMQRMRSLRASISRHDSARRFTEMGVDVFFGQGQFIGNRLIEVAGSCGDRKMTFAKACIATGGKAGIPAIPGLESAGYLTNETVFSLTEIPQRLMVIGGGPIGVELAQAFARFGSQVCLLERGHHLLSRDDSDAARIIKQALLDDGVEIIENATLERVSQRDSTKTLTIRQKGLHIERETDEILLAVGRVPNVNGLNLGSAGIQFSETDGIQVNRRLQTSNRHVFAAGDVASKYQFTHAADFMARAVIQNALFPGPKKNVDQMIIPWATYTTPELAHVGLNPTSAESDGVELQSFTQEFRELDRAVLDGTTSGFVRIHVRKGSDQIVGATVVGPHAGDLICEIALAMSQRVGLKRIAGVIHPYPTYAESIRKIGDAYQKSRFTGIKKRLLEHWFRWIR